MLTLASETTVNRQSAKRFKMLQGSLVKLRELRIMLFGLGGDKNADEIYRLSIVGTQLFELHYQGEIAGFDDPKDRRLSKVSLCNVVKDLLPLATALVGLECLNASRVKING